MFANLTKCISMQNNVTLCGLGDLPGRNVVNFIHELILLGTNSFSGGCIRRFHFRLGFVTDHRQPLKILNIISYKYSIPYIYSIQYKESKNYSHRRAGQTCSFNKDSSDVTYVMTFLFYFTSKGLITIAPISHLLPHHYKLYCQSFLSPDFHDTAPYYCWPLLALFMVTTCLMLGLDR